MGEEEEGKQQVTGSSEQLPQTLAKPEKQQSKKKSVTILSRKNPVKKFLFGIFLTERKREERKQIKDTVAKRKADENESRALEEAKRDQVKASVRERNEVRENEGEGVRERNGDETVTKSDEEQVEVMRSHSMEPDM